MDEGAKIPDVTVTIDAADVSLANLGAPLVVYFYPKDDTAGCTAEAKDFSALAEAFESAGVTVVGISKDTPASHAKFIAKHALAVRLASDGEGVACDAFGVWVEKAMYGRKYMGIERATFLFGADGTLAKAWRKVRVPGHAEAVLAAVKAL
ncbi:MULTISPECIES: peroxiredoxin [unclassified Sphingomonas]|uniref:peroxiredoxin n=1 Tax=unclassified Sphingomonas TaxID=196159 RepID=UPI0006FD4B66|nr:MULTISPECIES: peroxiredoxin [unclassified Sphingomonas]KQN24123.1 alkyl hydroperoxide reductase [Sphingomonas sp. Leaf34]KQN27625.1 alkyl hydroperoxide reductase [Sphingomonas sp. Leaf38]